MQTPLTPFVYPDFTRELPSAAAINLSPRSTTAAGRFTDMSSVSTERRLPAPIHARSSIRVDADDLRHAVVSLLHSWWMPTPRRRRWLDNPFYRSYGVLTMCRMRYT